MRRYTKQWPLAGEFVEFEYSPKIRQFGKFEYSPKWPFPPFWPDSIHSPAIRQLLSPDSIHSTDIRQPLSPDSIHSTHDTFAGIRQNETRIRHIRASNSPFWRIWREWPLLKLNTLVILIPLGMIIIFIELNQGTLVKLITPLK